MHPSSSFADVADVADVTDRQKKQCNGNGIKLLANN
jgi:hypothetical protein